MAKPTPNLRWPRLLLAGLGVVLLLGGAYVGLGVVLLLWAAPMSA